MEPRTRSERGGSLAARSAAVLVLGIINYQLSISNALAQNLQQQELPSPISSRTLPIRVTNLGIEQGLSMSVAYSIFQDRYGFIWIGGQDGVNRFDGYDVKVYKSEPFDEESFPDGWAMDIAEDEDGALWFATWDGVAKMNRVTETFTHYRHDPDEPKSLASDQTFAVQPHDDGRIWVATEVGLDLLDPVSREATHYRHDPADPESISNDRVRDVVVDAAGNTWFVTDNGINKLTRDSQGKFSSYLVEPEGPSPSSVVHSVLERPVEPEVLWLLASDALLRFDPETAVVKRYAYPFGRRPQGFDGVGRIAQDPVNRNVIWMSTYGHGLLRFDIRNEQFVAFKTDRDNPTGLTSNAAQTIYVDRSGTIWVGMEGSGVDRFNPASAGVTHYRAKQGLSGMLPGASVWGISEAPDGTLWVATQDESSRHRVSRINRETGAFHHFEHRTNDPGSLGAGAYYRLRHDHTGTLWVTGLFGDGISRYVPSTNRWVRYGHREGDPTSLINNNVS
ncbi:MAG TPA: two-component regulator propeller domain-containing protein, partial [Rhodothermia bacterium]